ncbi:MAG: DUF6134 family protein [Thiolinea sp.]
MMKTISSMLIILTAFALLAGSPAKASGNNAWRFQVLLDGTAIGQHSFNVSTSNNQVLVKTNASFAVKFLGFTAYTYQHNNTERWQGACLNSISANTNDNGEQLIVNGTRQGNNFALKTADANSTLPACLKSFAYWNLAHMKSPQLLNSQTGELMSVRLQAMGNDNIMAGGQFVPAKRYRLTGRNLQIDLWYSAQNRWLGLESLKDGRRIRYVLQ